MCLIIGVDEVGRGCLAGDVYAVAAKLRDNLSDEELSLIQDSKKISKSKLKSSFEKVESMCFDYQVGVASVTEINEHNILNATMLAMSRAIKLLLAKINANHKVIVYVDGNKAPNNVFGDNIEIRCLIKGDDKIKAIGAASILAKYTRDCYMSELDQETESKYGFARNAGYGTKEHVSAIRRFGVTKYHRRSFVENYIIEKNQGTLF